MPVKIRRLLSGNKRTSENGFDLNLTYIKPNIIAMGFPYETLDGIFKINGLRMDEVVRFLDLRHLNHYRVYNLSERTYDSSKFHMRTISYPFDANCPPPFELIQQFCEDMSAFLNADDRNVAVVHCCNGVQRTGIMVCSYLLHDNIFYSAKDALQFFATARTRNGVGIVIPSQQRYVQYYEHMVKKNFAYFRSVVLLESLKFIGNPCTQGSSCSPYFTIKIQKVKTYSSKDYDYIRRSGNITEFLLQQQLPLSGDVTIEFYHQSRISSKEKMFACCFNTSFVDMHLQSQQCKKQCKNRCKQTPIKLHRPLSTSFLDSVDDDSAFEFNTSSNTPQNNSPLLTVSSHSVIKKCHSLTDVHAADDGIMIHEQHGLLSSSDSHGSEPRERTQSDFRFLYKKMMPHDRQLRRALKKAGRHAGVDITTGFTTVVHKPVKHNKASQNTSQDVPPVMVSGPATSDEWQAHNSNSASSSSGSFEESLDHRELVTIVLPLSKLDHTAKSIRHISDDFQLHIVLSVDARVVKDLENDGCFDSDDSHNYCTHCTCGDDFARKFTETL